MTLKRSLFSYVLILLLAQGILWTLALTGMSVDEKGKLEIYALVFGYSRPADDASTTNPPLEEKVGETFTLHHQAVGVLHGLYGVAGKGDFIRDEFLTSQLNQRIIVPPPEPRFS